MESGVQLGDFVGEGAEVRVGVGGAVREVVAVGEADGGLFLEFGGQLGDFVGEGAEVRVGVGGAVGNVVAVREVDGGLPVEVGELFIEFEDLVRKCVLCVLEVGEVMRGGEGFRGEGA